MAEKNPDHKGKSFIIKVKTRDSQVKDIEVEIDWSIPRLKVELEKATGISASSQRLIYMGKVLKDDQQIADYGIKEEDTIHLVKKPSASGSDGGIPHGDSHLGAEEGPATTAQTTATYTYNFQPSQQQGQLMMGTITVPEGHPVPDLNSILRGVLSGFAGPTPQALHIQTTGGPLHLGGAPPFMMFPPSPPPPPPPNATPGISNAPGASTSSNAAMPSSSPSPTTPPPRTLDATSASQPIPQSMQFQPVHNLHNALPLFMPPPRPIISSVNLHIHATPADLEQLPARLDRLSQQVAFNNMASSSFNLNSWRSAQLNGFPMDAGTPQPPQNLFVPFDPLSPPTGTRFQVSSTGPTPTGVTSASQPEDSSPSASAPSPPPRRAASPVPGTGPSHATSTTAGFPPTTSAQIAGQTGSVIQQGSAVVGGILQALSPMMQQLVSGVQRSTSSTTQQSRPAAGTTSAPQGTQTETQSAVTGGGNATVSTEINPSLSSSTTSASVPQAAPVTPAGLLLQRLGDVMGLPDIMNVISGNWTPTDKMEAPIQEFLIGELERTAEEHGREPMGDTNVSSWADASSSAMVTAFRQADPVMQELRRHVDEVDEFLPRCEALLAHHIRQFVNLSVGGEREPGQVFSHAFRMWWLRFVGEMVELLVPRGQSMTAAEACIGALVTALFQMVANKHPHFAAAAIIGPPMAAKFIMSCYEDYQRDRPQQTGDPSSSSHVDINALSDNGSLPSDPPP